LIMPVQNREIRILIDSGFRDEFEMIFHDVNKERKGIPPRRSE
jgi:hypothetical protein